MSGMGSVGACDGGRSAANANTAAIRERMNPSRMAEKMQAKLDESLSSAGVSQETRDAIQADLKAAFEDQMSSGSKPDPAAMKETISRVFEEYGLDAQDFMPQGGPRGIGGKGGMGGMMRGMGGMTGAQSANGSQTNSFQTLIETLQEMSDDGDSDGETDTNTTSNELSEQVLDYLFGLDEEA